MKMQICALLFAVLAAHVAAQTATEVKWCIPYDQPPAYADLCTKTLAPANTDAVTFTCVVGKSPAGCMSMIAEGEAHLSTFDGVDMFQANTELGLTPLLFENYGQGVGTSYYAVAAVKKEFCDETTTLASLKGVRSCHTGYRKTAGWFSPLGALLASGAIEEVREDADVQDDAESIAAFFSKVCAPRTTSSGPKVGGTSWDKLCSGCAGDCTTHDRYYDYQGAFRCLQEDAGDVAFIKHSTIPDFGKGGKKAEDWAKDGVDAFRLVCPSGGCRPVEDFRLCNTAKVPSHAVIGPPSFLPTGKDAVLGKSIQDAIVAAAEVEGFLASAVQLNGQKNFIFKSGTVGLDAVTTPFEEAVGPQTVEEFKKVVSFIEDADGDR